MEIWNRIKSLRLKRGYSQNMLADIAGISQTHLRRVELGQADITVGHLELICDALGISLQQFFETEDASSEAQAVFSALSTKQQETLLAFLKTVK